MIVRLFHIIPAIALLLFACHAKQKENNLRPSVTQNTSVNITLDIQPFTGITGREVNYVAEALRKAYPLITVKKTIPLPQTAYYAPRNRYRADSLINFLSKQTPENHVTIGLTVKDISATKDKIADWGVMGLGFCPGNACIASSFRLPRCETPSRCQTVENCKTLDQLYKVAIHEAGHTQGLPHCPVKYCFMRDAEGGNPTDEEKEFCSKCRVFLKAKGWNLPGKNSE